MSDNYASRLKCRGCGRHAPSSVAAKARAADAAARGKAEPKQWAKPVPKSTAWADGPPKRGGGDSAEVRKLKQELRELREKFTPTAFDDDMSDPPAAGDVSERRGKLREVVATLTRTAGDDPLLARHLGEAKAELAALSAQRPPAVRLLALQRRSVALERKADRLVREGADLRAEAKKVDDKIEANLGDLDAVRQQTRALEEETRQRAAPDHGGDARTLAERIGIPQAYLQRPDVIAKKVEIEAAFDIVERLCAAAAAHAAADLARASAAAAAQPAQAAWQDLGVDEDELVAMAFGDPPADGGVDEQRKRFADKLRATLAKKAKTGG